MGVKTSRGYTLVEVLAVTAIMTFILGTLFLLVIQGLREWNFVREQTEQRNGANLVMHAIQKDLLKARPYTSEQEHRDGVYVSSDQKQLRIVTEWEAGQSNNPVTQKSVIVYTIHKDPVTQQTKVYRYAGSPPNEGQLGMELVTNDLDFDGSKFDLQNNYGRGRVLVVLSFQGSNHTFSSSFRFVYGS